MTDATAYTHTAMGVLDLYPTDVTVPDGTVHVGTRLVIHEGTLTVWANIGGTVTAAWSAAADIPSPSALQPGWPASIDTDAGTVSVVRSTAGRCWSCGNPLRGFKPYPGPRMAGV